MAIPAQGPAVWLYPKSESNVEISLEFYGAGFMTISAPPYQDRWRIHVDPTAPFFKYTAQYGYPNRWAYLDYDGFRDGPYQTSSGWRVSQTDFIEWHREILREIGYIDAEIHDAIHSYGRGLLERRYPEEYFLVYPQAQDIVDQSVSIRIEPKPDYIYRLWFYFVPTNNTIDPLPPVVQPIERRGFSVVEIAYLTDHEIPTLQESRFDGGRLLAGVHAVEIPVDIH